MSYSESLVTIVPKLSELNDKVKFTFLLPKEFEGNKNLFISVKIILDVVYLKREIDLIEKEIKIENNTVNIEIDNFKLGDIGENELVNISSINFSFFSNESLEKKLIDEKVLILQIIKEKENIKKHII